MVQFGERKHPVSFQPSNDPTKEKESLLKAIKLVFDDVLQDEEKHQFVLSVKSAEWKGEFVELRGDMRVDSNCIVLIRGC